MREAGIGATDLAVMLDLRQRDARANHGAAGARAQPAQRGDAGEADDDRRRLLPALHVGIEVRPAGDVRARLALAGLDPQRLLHRRRRVPAELRQTHHGRTATVIPRSEATRDPFPRRSATSKGSLAALGMT